MEHCFLIAELMFNGYYILLYSRALSFCIPEPILDIIIFLLQIIQGNWSTILSVIFQCPLFQEMITCSELEYGQHKISSYSDNTE